LEEKHTQIKTAIYRPKTYWHDLKNDLSAAAGKTKITALTASHVCQVIQQTRGLYWMYQFSL